MVKKAVTLAVCLNVSVAHSSPLSNTEQTTVNNLANTAATISTQLLNSQYFVIGATNSALNGYLINNDAYQGAVITDAMQDAYNTAIQNYMDTNFYSAQDHLTDMANQAELALEQAVDDYAAAYSEIAVVNTIADMAAVTTTTEQAEAIQDYAVQNGADQGVTDTMQDNYNNSLAAVNQSAREFATYSQGALDPHLVEHMEQFADSYGMEMEYAVTSINPINSYITTAFYTNTGTYMASLTHSNYFTPAYSTQQVYADGQSLYNEQGQVTPE